MTVVIYNRYDSFVLASSPSLATLPYGGDFRVVPPFNGGLNLPPRTVVSAGSPRPLFFNHFCCIDFNMFFLCFFTQILINLFMFFNDFYIISPAHFLYGLGKFVFHILLFCRVLVFS